MNRKKHMESIKRVQTALPGVVAPCYQLHHYGGADNKLPQLHAVQPDYLCI